MRRGDPSKLRLARLLDLGGLNAALLRLQAILIRPHIRALNYHDVPPSWAEDFERQLRFYASRFVSVGLADLLELHAGRWRHERPGIILSFDDGLRCHAEVVAPLLEKHGFTGWFFLPVGFIDAAETDQEGFVRAHDVTLPGERTGERLSMTWDDARRLDARHVVGCHTLHHRRLAASLSREELLEEIVGAKERLEVRLGHPVHAFAWVGGEEWAYSKEAARIIREAGFLVSFMTNSAVIRPRADLFQLQRTNVEASDPSFLVRFQLSGLLDVMYAPKRRRVNRLTSAEEAS